MSSKILSKLLLFTNSSRRPGVPFESIDNLNFLFFKSFKTLGTSLNVESFL